MSQAMQPMRIGQFTDSYPPIINGVSAFVAEHHAELLAKGQDAHVFTFGYHGYPDEQRNVWRSFGLPLGTSHFRTGPRLSRQADRIVAELDILHAHEAVGIGNLALRLARARGLPLVFTNHTRHDLYLQNYPRLLQPVLLRYVSTTIDRFVHASDLTTAPSSDSARWLQSLAPDVAERVHVVCNGIRLDRFDRPPDRALRNAFDIPAGRTVFVYVGRVTPEKNLQVFAEALIQAVASGANAHWLVIGNGSCVPKLKDKTASVKSHVSLLGAIPRDKVPQMLAMADVFATPSLSEVNPVSVIEAMACGKPYLGLRAAWWDEFAHHRGAEPAGQLVGGGPRDLAAAIVRLCDDAALRAQMGAQAKLVSQRFDIRTVTAQWIDIYRHVMENAGRSRSAL